MLNLDEAERAALTGTINSLKEDREFFEERFGKDNVWNTEELTNLFAVHSFLAPFVIVTRKSDGKKGTVMFQHRPRFYFAFL